MERLDIVIDDQEWPKLRIVLTRTDVNGGKSTTVKKILYDQAYVLFEGETHNKLRPMVNNLIQRRTGR